MAGERNPGRFSVEEASRLYRVGDWSAGYVSVGANGHLLIHPTRERDRAIDLHEVVEGLRQRGISPPVLLRFEDVVRDRLKALRTAFARAIADNEYRGAYRLVYPVKVNQQRHVVEAILDAGAASGFGLEAGSKPELLAVLGVTAGRDELPIVCNGFKDSEYIEAIVLAAKLGRRIIPVVEKFSELELIVRHAERYGVRPAIGLRVKLSRRSAGRWADSSGLRAKFGLHLTEALEALRFLRSRGMEDCLELLHCHVGSQVSDIRRIKDAVGEVARVYVELHRMGAGLSMLDLGGGLGVDYDGSHSGGDSSVNYTLEEYASDVVYRVGTVCTDAGVPHPTLITESGRAVSAHHSVLVFDVLGATGFDAFFLDDEERRDLETHEPDALPRPVRDLVGALELVDEGRLVEAYHDAEQAHEEALDAFVLGYLDLPMRALAERLYWTVAGRLAEAVARCPEPPEELAGLEDLLADIYFCNLSVFQSLPDAWAIGQLFPVLPIHRLDQPPTRRAVLADITCDSEGKIARFPDGDSARTTLPVHPLEPGRPYTLAVCLVGAYQEILGDYHNLFGDTHAVHIALDDAGGWSIEEVVAGDTVREVLSYVQYEPERLLDAMRRDVERAVRAGRLSVPEGRALLRFYRDGLEGYTYLEEEE